MTKKSTKSALLTSAVALLLCCSMLIGATFAWFTDEVTSGVNQIVAGNLDVELTLNGTTPVNKDTKLFDGIKWEPGVVAYENLTVSNEGTLDLKYKLSMVVANLNKFNGKGLDEALKVAVVNGGVDTTLTREDLIASIPADSWKTLASWNDEQPLKAGKSATYGIVIYWKNSSVDNDWNLNNGKKADDGKDYLWIDLGVSLVATQLASENDSFGPDYDGDAVYTDVPVNYLEDEEVTILDILNLPNTLGTKKLSFDYYTFDASSFQGEYPVEIYKDWICDYYVSTDKPVNEGLVLAGQYDFFGDAWLGFYAPTSDEPFAPTPLLGTVTQNMEYWNYERICDMVEIFRCGIVDTQGKNNGTTVTVELRMLNPVDNTQYITVCSISVIFTEKVSTADELSDAIAAGKSVALTSDITLPANETVKIEDDVTINLNGHDLTAETGSRPFQVYGGDLTIIATDSNVELDQYGLVDVREGDVKVSIIGGTFTGALNNGAVIKGRKDTKAEIYLKDVNMSFTDSSAKGSYVYNPDKGASAVTTIDGGVYNIDCGFVGNVTMKNATVNAKGFIFNGGGSVENCTLTTDGSSKAPADAAPYCCVAASHDREVTVKNSTLTATNCNAIEVYPTGGIVTVTDSTVNGSCYKHPLYDANDNCSITIDGVEQ